VLDDGGGEGRVIFIPIFPRSFLETAWGLCQRVRLAGGEDEFAELALAPDPSSLELGDKQMQDKPRRSHS
jgi:hypothetical protein